jgi:membrane fusion protein (multidrug efflux system)
MTPRKPISTVAMYLVVGALSLSPAACNRKKRRPDPKRPAVPVHVTPLAETVRSKDIVASGTTAPLRETKLATQVQGALIRSNLKLGRRVKKGELLARVSTVGLFGQARGARAQIQQIKTDLAKANRDHKQLKRLYEAKVESRKTYEDSRFLLRRLEAQLTGARATLAQIGEQYTGGVVKAPFDGIISHKGAEVGELIRELTVNC